MLVGVTAVGIWIFISAGCLWTGVAELRRGFTTVDLSARCAAGAPEPCVSERWATVSGAADSEGYLPLSYDDGRRTAWEILVGDAAPKPGTRLLLEQWGGRTVSLYDRRRGLRYRTDEWPLRWNGDDITLAGVGLLFLSPLLWGLACAIVGLVRRSL